MAEEIKPFLRIASKKPLRSDGIGNFYEEYKLDERYYPRIEIRRASGARISFSYGDISEINFTYLSNGEEDITLYIPNRALIRIIGKNFDKLFDHMHVCNVKWVREKRENEQFDKEDFFIDRISIFRIDNWFHTLDELIMENNRLIDEQEAAAKSELSNSTDDN